MNLLLPACGGGGGWCGSFLLQREPPLNNHHQPTPRNIHDENWNEEIGLSK